MRRFFLAPLAVVVIPLLVAAGGCGGTTKVATGGNAGTGGTSTGGNAGGGGTSAGGTDVTSSTGSSTCVPSTEVCDGMDNNCDGAVDEGCPCSLGQKQSCYTGDAATKDKGTCKSGMQTCDVKGVWGTCVGEVLPTAEKCNGQDDDCNGAVDDMGMTTCGVGACAMTVAVCQNGVMGTCVPGMPSLEICDGIDNNCNQLVDESFPEAGKVCDSGLAGVCKAGKKACVTEGGATAEKCVPDQMGTPETCDGLDNDCNGVVDDKIVGTGAVCSTGLLGPCSQGTVSCQGGVIDCFPNNPPSMEVCDGVDNDCNGGVDDLPGANMPCDTGLLGACKDGVNLCQGSSFGCVQSVQAQATDVCGDNIDNNCDGTVDEGCLYQFSGVATNLPIANLNGWQQCYIDNYANNSTPIATILAQCTKAKLLMACRPTGSAVLQVAANAPRLDVIFDTGTGNTPHNANNVGWYFNNSYSWGFAPQGDIISRGSCDTQASSFGPGADGDKRLCWHTGAGTINTGWRCGTNDSLNFVATFERIIYQAD